MIVLGLTGSIGMGKSTAAAMLRRMGVPVLDSDKVVHGLLGKGGAAVPIIARTFPGVVRDGAVDRQALGARVFGNPEALKRLEGIIHPLVHRTQRKFLADAARLGADIACLDIPLLFETGAERRVDATVVVSAPWRIQRARVLARPGITEEKLRGILTRQMPDGEKRRRADFVVDTGLGRLHTLRALRRVVERLRSPGSLPRKVRRHGA
ncbi:MAG TPA: dephospho-CoA kinase [Azospirillaceae bacterium]|nr:dephospho-CoA kinase [Azospirillaceae bacterium]